jgi:hypothetical protein
MIFGDYPGFLPGLALSMVLGAVVRLRVARHLEMTELEAWILLVAVGAVFSATLTPGADGGRSPTAMTACDVSRIGPATVGDYLSFGTTGLNVLLFVPLGVAVSRVGRPDTRRFAFLAAAILPVAIESTQLFAGALGRACQVADVLDNLIGLGIGAAAGAAGAMVRQRGCRLGGPKAAVRR